MGRIQIWSGCGSEDPDPDIEKKYHGSGTLLCGTFFFLSQVLHFWTISKFVRLNVDSGESKATCRYHIIEPPYLMPIVRFSRVISTGENLTNQKRPLLISAI
jgi:hypothetical protein